MVKSHSLKNWILTKKIVYEYEISLERVFVLMYFLLINLRFEKVVMNLYSYYCHNKLLMNCLINWIILKIYFVFCDVSRLVNLESLTSTLVIGTKRIWWVSLGKRVTIIIDDDVNTKLRLKQARLIQKNKEAISFSRVINDVCRDGLKNVKS